MSLILIGYALPLALCQIKPSLMNQGIPLWYRSSKASFVHLLQLNNDFDPHEVSHTCILVSNPYFREFSVV